MIILFIFLFVSTIAAKSQPLLNAYKKNIDKNLYSIKLTGSFEKLSESPEKEFYKINSPEKAVSVYLVISKVKGRFDFFDYMMVVSSELQIIDIKILKYRSEYGYEISNKKWLAQFYNKTLKKFEYQRDIDAISGASISAPSLVSDINQCLEFIGNIK